MSSDVSCAARCGLWSRTVWAVFCKIWGCSLSRAVAEPALKVGDRHRRATLNEFSISSNLAPHRANCAPCTRAAPRRGAETCHCMQLRPHGSRTRHTGMGHTGMSLSAQVHNTHATSRTDPRTRTRSALPDGMRLRRATPCKHRAIRISHMKRTYSFVPRASSSAARMYKRDSQRVAIY